MTRLDPTAKEQEIFEIEEIVQAFLLQELKEEYKLQRQYVETPSERRINPSQEDKDSWYRTARQVAGNFIKLHQDLLEEDIEIDTEEPIRQDLGQEQNMNNSTETMAIAIAQSVKAALQHMEPTRKVPNCRYNDRILMTVRGLPPWLTVGYARSNDTPT